MLLNQNNSLINLNSNTILRVNKVSFNNIEIETINNDKIYFIIDYCQKNIYKLLKYFDNNKYDICGKEDIEEYFKEK